MKQPLKFFLAITLLLLSGCMNSNEPYSDNQFVTGFFLMNSTGAKTTTFAFGEDIFFHYSILNNSRTTQNYDIDEGPFVTFELFQNDSLIGTTEDGLDWILRLITRNFLPADTLTRLTSWLSNRIHAKLPPGEYEVWANPRLQFSEIETPSLKKTKLLITYNANIHVNPVIITNQPPNFLQLDPFELKNIAIVADTITLNINHSGGCKEHNYSLYMSPAAFLESYPVQANLYLQHDSKGDACEALIKTSISFNLRPLADLYQDFYGQQDEIILNVFDFFEDEPANKLNARYFPE